MFEVKKSSDSSSSKTEQRIVASNMTQAMRLVGEKWGAEAVMLSSRRVAEGVEVVILPPGSELTKPAAADSDNERRQGERRRLGRRASDSISEQSGSVHSSSEELFDLSTPRSEGGAGSVASDQRNKSAEVQNDQLSSVEKRNARAIDLKQTAAELAKQIDALNRRDSDRPLSATQKTDKSDVANGFQFTDRRQQTIDSSVLSPGEFVVADRLRKLDLGESLVRQLLSQSYQYADSGSAPVEVVWKRTLQALESRVLVEPLSLCTSGGVYAITGPQGSGKTSVLIKLIAQLALENKAEDVAVIQFDDSDRRLQRIASVSGVQLITLSSSYSLKDCLVDCAGKRTVLIDTSANKRDSRVATYSEALASGKICELVSELLCLDARSSASHMEQVITQFRSDATRACVVTQCDEADTSGTALTALIHHNLPIAYRSTGALLPESLSEPGRGEMLEVFLAGRVVGEESCESEVLTPIVNLSVDQSAEPQPLNLQ